MPNKTICFFVFFLVSLWRGLAADTRREPADYVDPFIGTAYSRWMIFPGPTMPFGMVNLSPDNEDEYRLGTGYEYDIKNIRGFGHIHSWMIGSFSTMPTTGEVVVNPGTVDHPESGYRSPYRKENEKASLGYYSVLLDKYGVRAELTATTRTGFQRYTYPKTDQAQILFDLKIPEEEKPKTLEAAVKKISDREIAGWFRRTGGWNDYTLYFVARLNRPFSAMGIWQGSELRWPATESVVHDDRPFGAVLRFSTQEEQTVLLQTGVSFVSLEQARKNLDTETRGFGWDFEACRREARTAWNGILGRIEVEGGTEKDKVKFYTNMYHAYCARTTFSDVDGQYVDMCEKVQQRKDPNSPVFGCDAFWNTFWNLNQLWSLATPDIANQWVLSQLELFDKGGWLSKGPGGLEYSNIMEAEHEIAVIVNAFQKGIRNYDVEKAYRAVKFMQMTPGQAHPCGGYAGNRNLQPYLRMGYVPSEEGPVSNTLEYAYDDYCVAQMAKALHRTADYEYFMARSQNYKNVFDPAHKYMRPKQEGGPWSDELDPNLAPIGKEDSYGTKDYVEGNAWQYTWFVPHDVPGLVGLMGAGEFVRRLEEGFEKARPKFVSPFVNHSNQPNMQAAYLFNYAGKPWLTQKWAREIMENFYSTDPLGYPGDEDQGQMGAWFVMSAMGLFQMDGGVSENPVYEIGNPLFEKVVLHLDPRYYPGGTFVIKAPRSSLQNRYIQSARLNGKPLNQFWFTHQELIRGGTLELEMGPEPNTRWAAGCAPPYAPYTRPIVTTPYMTSKKDFLDSVSVSLACDTEGAAIFYTTDGAEPDRSARRYSKPFAVRETTTLKMRAYRGETASLPATAVLEKIKLQPAVDPSHLAPGISYRYYPGPFRAVNDFREAKASRQGTLPGFTLDPREDEKFFAFRFDGYLRVPADGIYTFYLRSNDGSRLFLDGRMLIDLDGLHPAWETHRSIALKAGFHAISASYFQEGGTFAFQVRWAGPGWEKQEIPAGNLFHAAP